VPRPEPLSQPRLAPGCRWRTQGEQQVVLFPEGVIRVQGTGKDILELCDGQRTVQDIVTTLSERYGKADPVKITEDVNSFLEALQRKRIVDY
jgi:pyrroloquinoline quinone biosynthesis protein D